LYLLLCAAGRLYLSRRSILSRLLAVAEKNIFKSAAAGLSHRAPPSFASASQIGCTPDRHTTHHRQATQLCAVGLVVSLWSPAWPGGLGGPNWQFGGARQGNSGLHLSNQSRIDQSTPNLETL